MKKLQILFIFLAFGLGAIAQSTAEEIVRGFVLPYAGGVFRGVEFDMLEEDLNPLEEDRRNVTFNYDEIDDDLYYTVGYDIDFDENNYAYLDYTVDFIGVIEAVGEIYAEGDDATPLDVFNELNRYWTEELGIGTRESDGWTRFEGMYKESDPYDVWIYLDEDEYGEYVRFELIYMGEE